MATELLLYCTLPGAAGGLTWFLFGVRRGRVRHDRYVRKGLLEIAGGLLVASFVAYPLAPLFKVNAPLVLLSFAAGAGWATIVQFVRGWITDYFKRFL